METTGIAELNAFYEETTLINVVIETSKGMPMKLKYDEKTGVFRVHKALPVGFTFPFNFGFVPGTAAPDGDPLDVLVLSNHVIPAGTVVLGRVIAALEAEQTEGTEKERNDRLIVVPWDMVAEAPMLPMVSFDGPLKHAITEFFKKYNEAQGKEFRPLKISSAERGIQLTRKAMEAARKINNKPKKKQNGNHRTSQKAR